MNGGRTREPGKGMDGLGQRREGRRAKAQREGKVERGGFGWDRVEKVQWSALRWWKKKG